MITIDNWIRRKLGWSVRGEQREPIIVIFWNRLRGCKHPNKMDLGDTQSVFWFCFDCESKLKGKYESKE